MNDSQHKGHPRFYQLLKLMEQTHDKKNADYSKATDPLSNLRTSENIGMPAIFGNYNRLGDKWERFTNIMHNWFTSGISETAVSEETVVDTLVDLANYCLLEAILIEEHWKKQKVEVVQHEGETEPHSK